MSNYAQSQVEELIIGNAVAAETTLATFITSASDQEIKILSADGTAPAAGEDFKVFQKTAGSAAKGLNYEFSDVVKADKVREVILKTYVAEVQKAVTVGAFAPLAADHTYAVEVRIFQDGGSLSPENFATVTGYYVSGATAPTAAAVQAGILASLNANLTKRGAFEVTAVDGGADEIDIAGIYQSVVQGKITGAMIQFDVTAKVFDNAGLYHKNIATNTVTVTTAPNPGAGTGKYAQNLEWFTKGFKYDASRYGGYPADFMDRVPFYASAAGVYNVIHIRYYSDRTDPTHETQEKCLTILIDKGTDTLGNNAGTNAVLDDLQTILGAANVPADLDLA
ncbi:MAG: hypothetical protein ACSLE0_23370 [Chitinophagaceae bacterium]